MTFWYSQCNQVVTNEDIISSQCIFSNIRWLVSFCFVTKINTSEIFGKYMIPQLALILLVSKQWWISCHENGIFYDVRILHNTEEKLIHRPSLKPLAVKSCNDAQWPFTYLIFLYSFIMFNRVDDNNRIDPSSNGV